MPRVPLQQFEHDRSAYERPNLDWVCGRASCGKPCALGPDHTGGCHTTSECVPTRQGDRWVCARPGTQGGRCDPGPRPDGSCCRPIVPCTPVRSLRSVRGSVVRWTVAASLGLLLLLLGIDGSEQVFSPGPLSAAHSSLMTRDIALTGASQCSACHADSNSTVAQIIRTDTGDGALVAPATGIGPVLSEKCMDCHLMGAHALRAHNRSEDELGALTAAAAPSGGTPPIGLALARSVGVGAHAQHASGKAIECVACHTEHHGGGFDIARISDQQCQTCHAQPFAQFTAGHPEFDGYPYDTPTRIEFNHATHINTHFNTPEHADKRIACMTCHVSGSGGEAMLVRGYEQSCLDCHDSQIVGRGRASVQGVAFFTLPPMDVRSIEDHGGWIGDYPADSAIYGGDVTPFMRLMLAADEPVAEALQRTDARALADLYEADDQTIDDAVTIAWGVKRLMLDILSGGQREVQRRIERALGRPLTRGEASRVIAGLPINAMVGARDAWFPELHNEVAMHKAGIRPKAPEPETTQPPTDDQPDDDADTGGGLLGGLSDDDAGGLLGGSTDDDDAGGLLGGSSDDDDDLGGLLGGIDDDGDNDDLGSLLGGGGGDDADAADATPVFRPTPFEMPDAESWVEHGGWFLLDAATLSLMYRPTGHADTFMRAWLDLSTPRASNGRFASDAAIVMAREGVDGVFAQLSDRQAPGVCMKCHTVDQSMPGAERVHWHALGPDPETTAFTRFTHRPHLTDLGDNACSTCHRVASLRPASDASDGRVQACFMPLSIEGCQECHNPAGVDTSCLGCHNYHVGVTHVRTWGGSLDTLPEGDGAEGATPAPSAQGPRRVPFWRRAGLASGR